MKAKNIVFFGAMSSILLVGTANADTHVSTKGYADTHVAGAQGPKTTVGDTNKIIKTTANDGTQYELVDMPTAYTPGNNVDITNGVITATDTRYTSGAATTVTDNGPINVDVDNSTIKIDGDKLTAVIATNDTVGMVKAGTNVTIDADGKLSATDTTSVDGAAINITAGTGVNAGKQVVAVKYDDTLSLTEDGELHVNVTDTNTTYNSGVATTIDGNNNVNVDVDGTTIVTTGDKLSVPIATTGAVGVVKVGDNLSIDANGKLDATDTKYSAGDRVTLDTISNKFSADLATATTAGAVLPDGSTINLNASDGKISVPTATPNSYGIVKYDNDTITTNTDGQLVAKQAQYVSHVDTFGNHLDKTGTSISAGIDGIIPAPTNYYSFYAGSGDWVEPTTIINWTLPNKCRIPNVRCSLTSYAGNDGKAYMRWELLTNTYYNDDGTDTMPTNVNDDSSFPAPPAVR